MKEGARLNGQGLVVDDAYSELKLMESILYEIHRSLKRDERIKRTPDVLVSSKNHESDRVWGRRQGADEYLGKPFTAEQLVTVVPQFIN